MLIGVQATIMATPMNVEEAPDSSEELARYLGYTCDYFACKYKDTTWGDVFQKDPGHFADLLSYHVGASTKTFEVLSQLLSPEKRIEAKNAMRIVDTPQYQTEQEEYYLSLTCNYNGKSKGKTWREIRDNNYSFFVWAVGNAMGRDTKSFNVFKRCLKPEDRKMVEDTAKGEVRFSKRRKKYQPIRGLSNPIAAH